MWYVFKVYLLASQINGFRARILILSFIIFFLSSCRLNDNRLRGVLVDTGLPVIEDFSVTNSNYTNETNFGLNFRSLDAHTYCILENDTDLTNCSWTDLPLPTNFAVSEIEEEKILSAWIRDEKENVSERVDSGPIILDTTKPEITDLRFFLYRQRWMGFIFLGA